MRYLFTVLLIIHGLLIKAQEVQNPDSVIRGFEKYNKLCPILGGDSVRYCYGMKCTGPVTDYYNSGKIKHKGYYDRGQIASVFNNYFENGNIERAFQAKSESRGLITVFYSNGHVKSKGEYVNGKTLKWEDFYVDGTLEYSEKFNKNANYHLYTRFYFPDGNPQILFEIIDARNRIYSYKSYYVNGNIEEQGFKIQNKSSGDYVQDGKWQYYSEDGRLILEEDYIKGMLNSEKDFNKSN
ncbi:MAG: hypothetical protein PHR81_01690 [Bacteroidales bacterium]|jgi:antitoxin component YwqK of YwqJK toxin-antitoxin module|nr:hypothetical protein [Bacteroidales bacterium]MDD4213501.1 hypothetical protein [Bacteroidales bacterium]